jgi:hypothetical protein
MFGPIFVPKPSPDKESMPFGHAPARLTIGSIDQPGLTVTAQYNPHELQIKKQVPWGAKSEHGDPAKPNQAAGDSHEFTGAPTRSMTLELLFDGFESSTSVEPIVGMLEEMSAVRTPGAPEPEHRRPHFCVVAWGEQGVKPFRCVIMSLAVRYTMFAKNGTPLRAACTVELAEARLSATASSGARAASPARATAARP